MAIPEDMRKGAKHTTKDFGVLVVVEYHGAKKVDVRFVDTGFALTTRAEQIRAGSVMDKLKPNTYGVGFIGIGDHKSKRFGKDTEAYKCWSAMLRRCYSEAEHQRKPWYIGCTACPEWHNFQNFAKWYDENYPADGGDYHLDKDIKCHGNKEYSPNACMFVTPEDNAVKANAMNYTLLSPEGASIDVYNMATFARANDLCESSMRNLTSGRVDNYKGWKLTHKAKV